MPSFLIDTNVMLAASAVFDELSNLANHAEPPDPHLREIIFNWLTAFEQSGDVVILDTEFLIQKEYERKMRFNRNMQAQEYGLQVLQAKHDQGLVDFVPIEAITGNGETIAILSQELEVIVQDREDRKWVAASISALDNLDEECPIVYGAESDWFRIEDDLRTHGICFLKLLPDEWYERRHGGGQ